MTTSNRFSPEVRARAVRLVREHQGEHPSQWAAITSIASKFGCTAETLRNWVRQAERDSGQRGGLMYRHGFLGQPGECNHAAGVSANARRATAGARKPSRSINHCWL